MGKAGWISYDDYIAEEMRDPVEAAGYLDVCLEDSEPGVFMMAVRDVVNANGGIAAVAKKTGLNRENLYKMLSPGGNPRFDSLLAILSGLGFVLHVGLAPKAKKRRQSTKKRKAA